MARFITNFINSFNFFNFTNLILFYELISINILKPLKREINGVSRSATLPAEGRCVVRPSIR